MNKEERGELDFVCFLDELQQIEFLQENDDDVLHFVIIVYNLIDAMLIDKNKYR